MEIPKLIRDGKVAVLVSHDYGAGWSTWNRKIVPECIFDPELAQAVLDEAPSQINEIASRKYPDAYMGGLSDLRVEWIDQGKKFLIDEYDGSEFILDESSLNLTA